MILGVDVGGTFTDFALWDGSRLATGKLPTTPRQEEAVLAGVRSLLGDRRLNALLHGTTAATNALLERRGARTALVTTGGFRDVIEIGRQDRPSLYDTEATRAEPLVARAHRFEVASRDITSPGQLAGDHLERLVSGVRDANPGAIAISMLGSHADRALEETVAGALSAVGVPLSVSSRVSPEFREFERTSTTVLNAYLTPIVVSYLEGLETLLEEEHVTDFLAVMRSSGGLMDLSAARDLVAALLVSGPAAGVMAAAALGRAREDRRIISFDMGGTSTDVCRIEEGRPEVGYERPIDGYPCRLPAVAVHTVGAGGGSVAWLDAGKALRVGPRSAGAVPGPAAYGQGGTAMTVTDANLLLGRLSAEIGLGGSLRLHPNAAAEAARRLGEAAGLDEASLAFGVVEVVESHMAHAIRRVSIEEGGDPREATLVAFGGAGGMHASALARSLEMTAVVVPPHAGVFSALGLLLSPPRADRGATVLLRPEDERIVAVAAELGGDAADELQRSLGGVAPDLAYRLDVRYIGQSHETVVGYRPGDTAAAIERAFTDEHRRRNGFARPGDPIEVVNVRAVAGGEPILRWEELGSPSPAGGEALRGTREVRWQGAVVEAGVWRRDALPTGQVITGPALILEVEATTWLAPGDRCRIGEWGELEITW